MRPNRRSKKDEVTTIDNQSWVSIHCYVVKDWCHLPILISLKQVIEGGNLDNFTKVIMGVLIRWGVSNGDVATKLMSFGAKGVNVFQGVHNGMLPTKSKINLPPTWKAFIAWHIALI
jgi:hypothetical protein